MSARSFRATCTHPNYAQTSPGAFEHWRAHGYPDGNENQENRTMTFTDPAEAAAHFKLAGIRYDHGNGRNGFPVQRPWKPPTRKPFDPQLGEVGSWVGFPIASGGYVTGQVWSVRGRNYPRVYVADGATYHDVAVSDLAPAADPAQQLELYG